MLGKVFLKSSGGASLVFPNRCAPRRCPHGSAERCRSPWLPLHIRPCCFSGDTARNLLEPSFSVRKLHGHLRKAEGCPLFHYTLWGEFHKCVAWPPKTCGIWLKQLFHVLFTVTLLSRGLGHECRWGWNGRQNRQKTISYSESPLFLRWGDTRP